jgi:glycosyltransferase involved in cell wall biosynthesis
LRIGIYQVAPAPEAGGAHTFESEVTAQLGRCQGEHEFVTVVDRPMKTPLPAVRLRTGRVLSAINALGSLVSRPRIFDCGVQLRAAGIDLLYSSSPGVPCLDFPCVVTCWDLQHRLQPYFPEVSVVRQGLACAWDHRERQYQTILPRAAGIVAGTETGKAESVHFYRVASERVHVIPFFAPSKLQFIQAQRPDWLPQRRFIVYPAQFWPHKNHLTLLRAFKLVHQAGEGEVALVLTGSDKPAEFGTLATVRSKALEMGLSDSVFTPGFVSDSQLRWLYENAESLAFVSHFGPDNLPPLEAMSLGCAVVAANVSGASEQLGDCALFVDPYSESSIADALISLLKSPQKRDLYVQRGRALVASRSLATYAKQLLSLFDQLALVRRCW